MTISIFEVLLNAQHNLKSPMGFQKELGMNQLDNAIKLIENGKTLNDDFNEADLTEAA